MCTISQSEDEIKNVFSSEIEKTSFQHNINGSGDGGI